VIKRFYLALAEMKGNAGGEQPLPRTPHGAVPQRWASKGMKAETAKAL
jgi:hypothetical protein